MDLGRKLPMTPPQDHVCKLCEEGDISPNDLIPNPLLRKKVAAFKNSTAGLQKTLEVSCGDLVSMS